MEYISLGDACDDCIIAIANDDYTGMNDEQERATKHGLRRIGKWLVVGDETGFSMRECCVCGGFAGNRHEVGYLE